MSGRMTSPARLDPPLRDAMTDAAGIVTPVWGAWFQALADRTYTESVFWASLAASPSYADDGAAAAGGVGIGGRYRSGSFVMVRVS